MKAVFALAFAGAVAAIPAGWSDAPADPVKITSTEPAEETKTWADESIVETTTPVADETAHTWEDVTETTPVADSTTSTWADYSITTPVADETATSTWGDYSVPVTETTSTVTAITTYCAKPTTFTDKGDVYTVTEATTLILTKGPYTVTIPVYEETSTVCDEPVAPTGAASTWVRFPPHLPNLQSH